MQQESVSQLSLKDLEIFMDRFRGREDYFAQQMPGGRDGYRPIHRNLNSSYLGTHLKGDDTYGIYILNSQSCANLICFDLDIPHEEAVGQVVATITAKLARLQRPIEEIKTAVKSLLYCTDSNLLVEDTGGRGLHIWLFLDSAVSGHDLVRLGCAIQEKISGKFEFFPKQGQLNRGKGLGNLVKLPLGVHQRYGRESHFLRCHGTQYEPIESISENLKYLSSIEYYSGDALKTIVHSLAQDKTQGLVSGGIEHEPDDSVSRTLYQGDLEFLTEHCIAIGNLSGKANNGIPLSRREAFHFANTLMSLDGCEKRVVEILQKSYGPRFLLRKTGEELDLIRPLHPTSCATLNRIGICEEVCCQDVRDSIKDDLVASPNPPRVWLLPVRKASRPTRDLTERIQQREAVVSAYWKLKKYHRDEDMLFYDEFAFTDFEDDLDLNCAFISKSFFQTFEYSLDGFQVVSIPKKLSSGGEMEYRNLAYCSVFDSVYHQILIDAVGPVLEESMHQSSYGYRLNDGSEDKLSIFKDWRTEYPLFRGQVVKLLGRSGNEYYVCCDIEKFYDNINHDILCGQIATSIDDTKMAEMLFLLVRSYSAAGKAGVGVPQGPAYARVFANLYLSDFDKQMAKIADGCVRYVDDIFIFSRTEDELRVVLEKAHHLLGDLGLRLSMDENKKAVVRSVKEDEAITAKMDEIQYGIMEEFRDIRTFNLKDIRDFYAAVRKHNIDSVGPAVEKLNERVPAMCYLLSKHDVEVSGSLEREFAYIIDYLVSERKFFPKRQKFVFRILGPLLVKHGFSILEFYEKLDNSHRTYLLLAMHDLVKHGDFFEDQFLAGLCRRSVEKVHPNARGIALRILANLKHTVEDKTYVTSNVAAGFDSATDIDSYHALHLTDYWKCSAEEQALLRSVLLPTSRYLKRKALLSRSSVANSTYVDDLFMANMFQHQTPLLLMEVARLLPRITADTHLFRKACAAIADNHSVKQVTLQAYRMAFQDFYKDATTGEISLLTPLYKVIEDQELREFATNIVVFALEQIPGTVDFHTSRMLMSAPPGCQRIESKADKNQVIENIDQQKLSLCGFEDSELFSCQVRELARLEVIPESIPTYDSRRGVLSLQFSLNPHYKIIDATLREEILKDPARILALTEDLYKRANYFHRQMRRIPLLDPKSVAVDPITNKVIITTLVESFRPYFVLENERLAVDQETEIPRSIAMYWRVILFNGSEREESDYFKRTNSPEALTLQLVLRKFRSKKPEMRYSHQRVRYLLSGLLKRRQTGNCEAQLSFYFQERFLAAVFSHCEELPTWINCGNALQQFCFEVLERSQVFGLDVAKYTNKAKFGGEHYLSFELANLSANAELLLNESVTQTAFFDMYKMLNWISVLGIETLSFAKSVSVVCEKRAVRFARIQQGSASVRCGGLTFTLGQDDVESINALLSRREMGKELVDPFNWCWLNQLCLMALFMVSDQVVVGDELSLSSAGILPRKDYESLAECALGMVPKIEQRVSATVADAVRCFSSPAEQVRIADLEEIVDHIKHSCTVFVRVSRCLGVKRHWGRIVRKETLPFEIQCKHLVGKRYTFRHSLVNRSPLTADLTRSPGRCSWDTYKREPVDVVVPNVCLEKLTGLLRRRKLFGRSLRSLLTGRSFVILFVLFSLLVLGSLVWVSGLFEGSLGRGALWVVRSIIVALLIPLLKWLTTWRRKQDERGGVLIDKQPAKALAPGQSG